MAGGMRGTEGMRGGGGACMAQGRVWHMVNEQVVRIPGMHSCTK